MIVALEIFSYITWEPCVILIVRGVLLILVTPILQSSFDLCFGGLQINNRGFLLSFLSLLTFYWAIGYSSDLLRIRYNHLFVLAILVLICRLQLFFITRKIFILYIIFELSVVPIFTIIMGWGYQSERLGARLRLIFYTLTASIPLLFVFIWLFKTWSWATLLIIYINSSIGVVPVSLILIFRILIAFAVKLPIFGVHIWLPKAHVEAPLTGSIVLAAILLKLGRFGLWIMAPLVFSLALLEFGFLFL